MKKPGLKEITGRIILVQEERFRMVDDSGRGYLFDLSHSSRTRSEDLVNWKNRNTQVFVEFEGTPNFSSGIAHRIEPLMR